MKDLTQLIEQLQQINIKIIEKDNVINWYTDLLNLFSQLVVDPAFKQSDVYLDLRVKYISKIEEKLQKINDAKISIEPEAVIKHLAATNIENVTVKNEPKKKPFTLTSDKIVAPLRTDIFLAPGNRYKFSKKKLPKKNDENDNEPECQYIQFTHKQKDYFIETNPNDNKADIMTYDIVDKTYQLMGQLKGDKITLLHQTDLALSETIDLQSMASEIANKLPKNKHILTNYVITD